MVTFACGGLFRTARLLNANLPPCQGSSAKTQPQVPSNQSSKLDPYARAAKALPCSNIS